MKLPRLVALLAILGVLASPAFSQNLDTKNNRGAQKNDGAQAAAANDSSRPPGVPKDDFHVGVSDKPDGRKRSTAACNRDQAERALITFKDREDGKPPGWWG